VFEPTVVSDPISEVDGKRPGRLGLYRPTPMPVE
jgi:hypothetical protein